jgi:hypothetical protein
MYLGNSMFNRSVILAAACVMGTGAAQAQGSGGYTWSGEVELGYLANLNGPGSAGMLAGDFTLEGTISGNVGFSIGLESVIIVGSGSEFLWAPYATIDWRTGNGRLRFGAPRFAMDDHLRAPILGGIRLYELTEYGVVAGGISYGRLLTLYEPGVIPAGVRYDGVSGNLSYSASAHYLFDTATSDTAGVFQLGATWKQGAVSVFGGIEHITIGSTIANLGAEYDSGQWRVGASVNNVSGGGSLTSGSAWLGFKPMQNLELLATASVIDDDLAIGLGAEYTLNGGYYLKAGVLNLSGGSSGTVANIAVGMRF